MKLFLAAMGCLFIANQAFAIDIGIVPYSSRGVQFLPVKWGALPDFASNNFNADFFPSANLPFGTPTGCGLNGGVGAAQFWPIQTDILVVKPFTVVSGISNVRVLVGVDDRVQVWVNGTQISKGMEINDNCPTLDQFQFPVPDAILKVAPEQNIIKVRARDIGGANYINFRVIGSTSDGFAAFSQEQLSVVNGAQPQ